MRGRFPVLTVLNESKQQGREKGNSSILAFQWRANVEEGDSLFSPFQTKASDEDEQKEIPLSLLFRMRANDDDKEEGSLSMPEQMTTRKRPSPCRFKPIISSVAGLAGDLVAVSAVAEESEVADHG